MSYDPPAEYQPRGDWGGVVRYGNDRHLVVMFYTRSVHNPLKSQAAGTRIHDSVDYVKMHAPGERDQIIDRPMNESDKTRFPQQWRAFQEGREQINDGIPVDMLFPSWPHIADNLRSYGIHTVEQCAEMSANALDNIGMGAQEYKNQAREYLEAASAGSNYHKFRAELESRDREIARLKRDLDAMAAQFHQVMEQLRRGVAVPAAMLPQVSFPDMPVQNGGVNFQGPQPIRGEPVTQQQAAEPRRDMMADIPQKGRIKRTWDKKPNEAHKGTAGA